MQALDLLQLVGGLDGIVPPAVLQVFQLARVMFQQGQILDDAAMAKLERIAGHGATSQEREVREPVHGVSVVHKGFRLESVRQRSRDLADLMLLPLEDLLAEDIDLLATKALGGELRVTDLRAQGVEVEVEQSCGIRTGAERSALNDWEQKLYFLFDQSLSMRHLHRLLYAQTLVMWFLHQKFSAGMRPHVYFRPFAGDVGPLVRVTDERELIRLVRTVLATEARKKGTDLETALLTAAQDIRYRSGMTQAQVIVVTDGLVSVDWDKVHAAFGDGITIHVVKVGRDRAEAGVLEERQMAEEEGCPGQISEAHKERIADKYHRQMERSFQEVCDTFLELGDIEMIVGLGDVASVTEMIDEIETESPLEAPRDVYRYAVFCSRLLSFMSEHASDEEVTKEIEKQQDRVVSWIFKYPEVTMKLDDKKFRVRKRGGASAHKQGSFDVETVLASREVRLRLRRLFRKRRRRGGPKISSPKIILIATAVAFGVFLSFYLFMYIQTLLRARDVVKMFQGGSEEQTIECCLIVSGDATHPYCEFACSLPQEE